ncbi:MAG: HEAT repeat domain-containing protein [Acidobacteria bacterium]|nr:HEAT repeat domain-containing protein [Acidobacteriota bacterium]
MCFVRDTTIRALGTAKDERAIPALMDASKNEIDPRLRRHARQAIASIRSAGSPEDLEALRNRLDQLEVQTDGLRERLDHLEQEKGGPLH